MTSANKSQYRRRWALVTMVVLVLLGGYLGWGYLSGKPAPPSKPTATGITITSATAEMGDIGVYIDAIGTVTPVYTSLITSQVTGLVVSVHYQEGQVVKKGDPLVDIDSAPFRATLLLSLIHI